MRETDKSSEQMGGEYAESIMEPREAEQIIAKRFERRTQGYGMERNASKYARGCKARYGKDAWSSASA